MPEILPAVGQFHHPWGTETFGENSIAKYTRTQDGTVNPIISFDELLGHFHTCIKVSKVPTVWFRAIFGISS